MSPASSSRVIADARRQFYQLAAAAIRAGLLTATERDVIARPGTRKAGYWNRHVVDLKAVIKERQVRRLERQQADQLVRAGPAAAPRNFSGTRAASCE